MRFPRRFHDARQLVSLLLICSIIALPLAVKPQRAILTSSSSAGWHMIESGALDVPPDTVVPPDTNDKGFVTGTLPGESAVDPDGAARYTIPLWVPPGRNGMQPDLTLSYNSRTGNGPLGVGWSLTGFHEIQRCHTIYAIDGEVRPIKYDETDPFCLDGQRLMLVSGKHGQPRATYKTERDTFAKIVIGEAPICAFPCPLALPPFIVLQKDGRIMRFGGASEFERRANRVDGNATVGWLLRQIEDRYGNAIQFSYIHEKLGIYPSKITYTSSSTNPQLIANRLVQFIYEKDTRPDVEFSAAIGLNELTKRLGRIEMFGPDSAMKQILLRAYTLAYCGGKPVISLVCSSPGGPCKNVTMPACSEGDSVGSITQRSLITSITESDEKGVSLPPTEFEYSHGEEGFNVLRTEIKDFLGPSRSDNALRGFRIFDMNGDGLDDLLYLGEQPPNSHIDWWRDNPLYYVRLSTGRGFGNPSQYSMYPARHDSQGKFTPPQPMLYHASEPPGLVLWSTKNLSRPDDAAWPAVFSIMADSPGLPAMAGIGFFGIQSPSPIVIPMDMDGDGLADLIVGVSLGNWQFYRNRGDHTFDLPKPIDIPPGLGKPTSYYGATIPMRGIDVNGAGRQALIVCDPKMRDTPGGVLTSDTCFETDLLTCNDELPKRIPVFFDANGDGLDDAVFTTDPPTPTPSPSIDTPPKIGMTTVLNRGGSNPITSPSLRTRTEDHELVGGVRVIDYDGDGHPDLAATRAQDVDCRSVRCLLNEVREIRVFRSSTTSSGIQLTKAFPNPTLPRFSPGSQPIEFSGCPFKVQGRECPPHQVDFELIEVGDVNGDGLQDLVTLQDGEFVLYLRKGHRPDMLVRAVNGLGAEATFRYAPISDPNVYKSVGFNFTNNPQRAVTGGLMVVAEHVISNGGAYGLPSGTIGARNRFVHHYEDALEDIRGRGFLGFRAHEVDEPDRLTRIRYEYDLSPLVDGSSLYPFAGLPAKEITTTKGGAGLCNGTRHELVVSRQFESHFNPLTKVYAPSAGTILFEESECVDGLKTLTYRRFTRQVPDDFGNVRVTSTTFGNGDVYAATLTYDNSDSDWLIDRKVKSVETSLVDGRIVTRITAYRYDEEGGLQRIVVEPGDDSGSVIKPLPQPQPDGVSTLFLRYDRDANGQVSRMAYDVDFTPTSKERFTQFFYEDPDQIFPTRIINKLGHTTRFAFHPGLGVQAAALDANGVRSRWQYDTFGRLKRSEPGTGEALSLTYRGYVGRGVDPNKLSLELMQVAASGSSTRVRLDILGRAVSTTAFHRADGRGTQTEQFYDQWGHTVITSVPHFEENPADRFNLFRYDAVGRLEDASASRGDNVEYTYRGLQSDVYNGKRSDPTAVRTTLTNDTGGQLVSSIQHARANAGRPARDLEVRYERGPFATVEHIKSLGSAELSMQYDRLGRLITVVDPSHGRRDFAFNAFGEMVVETIAKTGAAPENRLYQYDDIGRITVITTRDGMTKYKWDESTHGIGQLSSLTSSQSVVTTFAYDVQGRVSNKTWQIDGEQFVIGTDYDAFGRLERVRYPDMSGRSFSVRYKYGVQGSLEAIVDDATGSPYWTTLETDESGLATNPSGIFPQAKLGNGVITHWIEGDRKPGELAAIHTTAGNTVIQDLNYHFDSKRNLESRQDTLIPTNERFEYDELDRLQRWIIPGFTTTYNYDDLGNLRERVQTVGSGQNVTYDYAQTNGAGPYAVSAINGSPYSYNQEGNQITSPGRQVTFTTFGLPLRIDDGSVRYDFGYDGFGRRVFKRSNDNKEVLTIADLYERRSGGSRPQLFTVVGPYGPVCQVIRQSSGTTSDSARYIHADNLGSTESVTDQNGAVVETRQYDPFGNLIGFSLPGSITVNGKRSNGNAVCGVSGNCFRFFQEKLNEFSATGVSMGFTGHKDDGDLSLINMVGRMYDPTSGRFVSPDPFIDTILTNDGVNRYTYVANNPATFVDPTGFDWRDSVNDIVNWGRCLFGFCGGLGGQSPSGPQPGQVPSDLGRVSHPVPTTGATNSSPPQAPYNPVDVVANRTAAARVDYRQASFKQGTWETPGWFAGFLSGFFPKEYPYTETVLVGEFQTEQGPRCPASVCGRWVEVLGPIRPSAAERAGSEANKLFTTLGAVSLAGSLPVLLAPFAGAGVLDVTAGNYLFGKAPFQVTPGTTLLEGQDINALGRVEPWRAHYDQYGRWIGRTDFNAGNKAAGIPPVHHHVYDYSSRYPLGRSIGDHLPGRYRP